MLFADLDLKTFEKLIYNHIRQLSQFLSDWHEVTWRMEAVDYWNIFEKICMYLANWFCLYGLILELCYYESDLNYLNCPKLGHMWRWYFGLYLFLFVYVWYWPNNMISISTCVEFYGDQEYAKYRSCNLGIIVKKEFLLVFCRFLYNKKVMWVYSWWPYNCAHSEIKIIWWPIIFIFVLTNIKYEARDIILVSEYAKY